MCRRAIHVSAAGTWVSGRLSSPRLFNGVTHDFVVATSSDQRLLMFTPLAFRNIASKDERLSAGKANKT
jgi:hypothetical protein